jgi:hypothetical protein
VNLDDSSVDLGVRIWCQAEDYWELKFAMTKAVKEAFDQGGISIPYPHQVEITKTAGSMGYGVATLHIARTRHIFDKKRNHTNLLRRFPGQSFLLVFSSPGHSRF